MPAHLRVMLIHATEPLFAWGALEDCPTLATIREALQTVPDQALLDGLSAARGQNQTESAACVGAGHFKPESPRRASNQCNLF